MLTAEQIQDNKIKYITLLSKLNIDLTEFTHYLDQIDFFAKPASAQNLKAYPGGLCQHALDLYFEMSQLCNAYFPGRYIETDVIKVALLKDLYRAELYEAFARNVKNETTGQWESVLAYRNKEIRPVYGDIGFSSYMIAKKYFEFNDEQIEAICFANSNNTQIDIHNIRKQYPLVTLANMADVAASYIGTNV